MKTVQASKEQFNELAKGRRHSFLQSWGWGEFQERAGHKTFRIGFEDNGRFFFAICFVKRSLPLGRSYFYAPRIDLKGLTALQLKFIFDSIAENVKMEKAIFLRFEPKERAIAGHESRVTRTIDAQPSKTIILNLEKTEDELLGAMRQKTRYNIRLAEKKRVVIREARENDFEKFWRLMGETRERDGFRTHNKEYYEKMLDISARDGFASGGQIPNQDLSIRLFLAEYDGRIIAGNIIAFFGDTVTYMHGASGSEYRNVMAPYLLQWHIIRLAKNLEYRYYDFYGIDENRWPGVTRFKRGFGGNEVRYPGTFDLIFNRGWYSVYKLARKIRRGI
ncbi:MAG: peptidoglycan bridge formation glycyltransferase FemA/FemB family protein [Candidatus Falkowbacteria bacterium]